MRLAPWGYREIVLLTVVLGVLAAAASMLHWSLAVVLGIVWLCGLAFFRDPTRRIPNDPAILVSPADGHVTEVSQIEHDEHIGGPATRIGIFLSVFDVHVNRSPCTGKVLRSLYKPGEFLDARHPECGPRNESNTLVIQPEPEFPAPIVVRQVAGLIARRIVCAVAPQESLVRGQHIGMIKFGSRTELIVPRDSRWSPQVSVGQKVSGGSTVLMRFVAALADEKNNEIGHKNQTAASAR